ncbi:MAG: hypothetical protein ACO349_07855, partial [Flavobacteriaceae bacterium]
MIETKLMFTILLFLGSALGQTGYDVHVSGVAHSDGVAFGTGLALYVRLAHSPGATTVGDGSPINPNKKEMDGTA